MNVELTEVELAMILSMADRDHSGVIDYKGFIPLVAEVLQGLTLKQQTEARLTQQEELSINQACMVLYNDEILGIGKKIEEVCKKEDENKNNYVSFRTLREVLHNESHTILTEKEMDVLIRMMKDKYEENFPYAGFRNTLFSYKVSILKTGFMESNLNKLKLYLVKIFELHDQEKSGLIHISTLTDALSKADKIVLTKIQLIMIRSFVKKNQEGYVNYRKEAMFLGELIKKLFNPSVLKKQAQLIVRGEVKSDELMDGWTDQTLKKALRCIC